MEVYEVTGKKNINDFHKVPDLIYRDDLNYTPLLRSIIENTFNPQKNVRYKNGDARRWVVQKNGKNIGRIAAFYDSGYSESYDQPTGCFGFFECADDQQAANLLFDTARDWLKTNGMEAMDGPVNFGENFFYWGLLADGFQSQTFGMQYHKPYYSGLFENYGLKTFYEQYSYSMDITHPDLPDRFWKIAAWVAKKPGYSYRHFTFREQDKFIRDFMEIHRQAWSDHSNYKPAGFDELKDLIQEAKFILDEEFIWYVYYNNEPIAFFMMIPDLNQILRKVKSGKLGLWNILKLMYYKRKKTISRCRVIVLGVVPKFQRLGIESGIFYQLKQVMLRKPWYNDMEMSWVGDFNPKMNALFKSFGAKQSLTHLTMRYHFNPEKEFKRATIIN
jgi:hypothetical protein